MSWIAISAVSKLLAELWHSCCQQGFQVVGDNDVDICVGVEPRQP